MIEEKLKIFEKSENKFISDMAQNVAKLRRQYDEGYLNDSEYNDLLNDYANISNLDTELLSEEEKMTIEKAFQMIISIVSLAKSI